MPNFPIPGGPSPPFRRPCIERLNLGSPNSVSHIIKRDSV